MNENNIISSNEAVQHIQYREATPEDAEKMIHYLNLVGGESDNLMHGKNGFRVPVEAVRRRLEMLDSSDNSVVLLALDGQEIIARAELEGYPNLRMHHRAKFSISVRKDYWNCGIGTKMMTYIIEYARKMNLRSVELEVISDNKAAICLYHKMGFEDIGIYKDFWNVDSVYKDSIIMQKIIDCK